MVSSMKQYIHRIFKYILYFRESKVQNKEIRESQNTRFKARSLYSV